MSHSGFQHGKEDIGFKVFLTQAIKEDFSGHQSSLIVKKSQAFMGCPDEDESGPMKKLSLSLTINTLH